MNRKDMLNKLQEPEKVWDMVVVGGGATGLGVAVDAATRGYSVVLLEMADFAISMAPSLLAKFHFILTIDKYLRNFFILLQSSLTDIFKKAMSL
mgnify:CR=1 FL=1